MCAKCTRCARCAARRASASPRPSMGRPLPLPRLYRITDLARRSQGRADQRANPLRMNCYAWTATVSQVFHTVHPCACATRLSHACCTVETCGGHFFRMCAHQHCPEVDLTEIGFPFVEPADPLDPQPSSRSSFLYSLNVASMLPI